MTQKGIEMDLSTELIHIAQTNETDLDFVLAAEQDSDNCPFIIPWSQEQHSQAVCSSDQAHLLIRSCATNEPVGYAILTGLDSPNQSIELVRLVITQKGKGYGRAALRLIRKTVFGQWDCHRFWLDVKESNNRAKRLYESEGFVEEGRLRDCLKSGNEFESLIVLSMLEDDYRAMECQDEEKPPKSPTEVQTYPMHEAHLREVFALWERTKGLIITDTDNPQDLERYFRRNPGMSRVAINEGCVIGAVLCGHDGRRGYLHHLAVAPEHRNQGVGRALVEACLFKLKEAGIHRCNLFVVEENVEGKQFWSNDGWQEWPTIRLMSKEGVGD